MNEFILGFVLALCVCLPYAWWAENRAYKKAIEISKKGLEDE